MQVGAALGEAAGQAAAAGGQFAWQGSLLGPAAGHLAARAGRCGGPAGQVLSYTTLMKCN